MKISNSTPSYVNQTYQNQANAAASQNQKSQLPADEVPSDSINLSGRTKDLQKITRSMDANSVERQKYVDQIKLKVENNQYNVNAEIVASKMLGELFDGAV